MEREGRVASEGAEGAGQGFGVQQHGHKGQLQIFAGSSSGVGQLACGQPLRPQRCVGRASPATVLTPSPDVLGQHHRPQSPRSTVPHASPPSTWLHTHRLPYRP